MELFGLRNPYTLCYNIQNAVHDLTVLNFGSCAISLQEDPQFSYAPGSESRMRKLRLHYGDFAQANSNMADKTAGQLQSTLCVNKASAKAFESRTR